MTALVLGIDPGGRSIGWVLRHGTDLHGYGVESVDGPMRSRADAAVTLALDLRDRADQAMISLDADRLIIAIEGLRPPVGHLGRVNPASLIGVAVTFGALAAVLPEAVVVAPSKHGSGPLWSYPAALVGPRESSGTGRLRHARSAWDVAGAAAALHRTLSRRAAT